MKHVMLVILVGVFMVLTMGRAQAEESVLGGLFASLEPSAAAPAEEEVIQKADCDVISGKGWTKFGYCAKDSDPQAIEAFAREVCEEAPKGNCNVWLWNSEKAAAKKFPMEEAKLDSVKHIWVNRKNYLKVCGKDYC